MIVTRLGQFCLALVAVVSLAATPARAELIFASTSGGRLISFDSATPGTVVGNVAVSGVAGSLVGIDVRPATGQLYGVSNDGGVGRVYTIDPITGAASLVYTLTTALPGASYGVDFNPVPDALRIVSDLGQNLRITGFPTSVFVTNSDTSLSLTGVAGAAYSNNFPGTTATTLYDIRATDSSLYTQNPPNAGTLNLVGALGTTTNNLVGFDISGATGTAYASLNGGNNFGTVNLATGAYTNIGPIGSVNDGLRGQITGITTVAAVPEPTSLAIWSLSAFGCAVAGYRRRLSASRCS